MELTDEQKEEYRKWMEEQLEAQRIAEEATRVAEWQRETAEGVERAKEEETKATEATSAIAQKLAEMYERLASGEKITREEALALVAEIDKMYPGFRKAMEGTVMQLEKMRWLGRTYDETSTLFMKLAKAHREGAAPAVSAVSDLALTYAKAEAQLREIAREVVEAGGVISDHAKKLYEAATETLGWRTAADKLGREIVKVSRRVDRTTRRTIPFIRGIQRAGWRLGWLGFRLVMMGRIIMRWLLAPLRRAIRILTDWERSIDYVTTTLGLMAASGELTGERQERLLETIRQLLEVGPPFAAAFGYMSSALMKLATIAAPALIPLFLELGDLLYDLMPVIQEYVVPVIEQITEQFREWVPTLLEIARIAIPAFMEGVRTMLPLLMGFLESLMPLIPWLARAAGFLAPLAPLMVAAGMALYFLSPLLTLVTGLFRIFGFALMPLLKLLGIKVGLLSQTATGAVALAVPLKALIPVVAALAYVIIGIIAWWQELSAVWNRTVGPALGNLSSAFGELSDAIGITVDWMAIIKAATTPVYLALTGLMTAFGALLDAIAALVRGLADLERRLGWIKSSIRTVNEAFSGFTRGLSRAVESGLDFIENLCIPDVMSEITRNTLQATAAIGEFQREVEAFGRFRGRPFEYEFGAARGPITQYVTITAPITIETVAAEVDLGLVTDAVNRGIAEALRRELS